MPNLVPSTPPPTPPPPSPTPTLSLCMVVKNEAARLMSCWASAQVFVHEWIVVDTGSSDRTRELAREQGAVVLDSPWQNDFAAPRNLGLAQATGDWILVLDADETLIPEVFETLLPQLANPDLLVVNLLRHERGAAQSPYSLVSRLFRRHGTLRFNRPYHASIDDSVVALLAQEPHWQVLDCPTVALEHDGYHTEAIAQGNKRSRARQAMEGFLAEHPEDAYDCAKLGALYVEQGEIERGIALLHQGLAIPGVSAAIAYELHYHLGIAYVRQQQSDAAADHYQAALAQPILEPLKLGAYNNLASLLQEAGFLDAALDLYEQAIAIEPRFALAHYNAGLVRRAQGQLPAAIAAYQRAIALQPHWPEAHRNLGVAQLKAGQVDASLQSFRAAIALYQRQGNSAGATLHHELTQMGFQL